MRAMTTPFELGILVVLFLGFAIDLAGWGRIINENDWDQDTVRQQRAAYTIRN